MRNPTDKMIHVYHRDLSGKTLTLDELVEIADERNLSLSSIVVAEAMVKESKTYEEILSVLWITLSTT